MLEALEIRERRSSLQKGFGRKLSHFRDGKAASSIRGGMAIVKGRESQGKV